MEIESILKRANRSYRLTSEKVIKSLLLDRTNSNCCNIDENLKVDVVAFIVAGNRLQVSPRVFADMWNLDMLKITPSQLPYLVWMNNDVRGLENITKGGDSKLMADPHKYAQDSKQELSRVLSESFGVGSEESKAEMSLKQIVGKTDIVASLKDRMNVVHFFRNFDQYDTLIELKKVLRDARNQLVKRCEMEIDCFFLEMAIKTKKQCRVIRNDLKAVSNQLAAAADKIQRAGAAEGSCDNVLIEKTLTLQI